MSRVNTQSGSAEGLTAEDRVAYAAARAAGNERANRPVWAIACAGVVLAGALIALVVSLNARSSANTTLANERARAAKFVELAAAYRRLSESADSSGVKANEPIVPSVLQNPATRAGMVNAASLIPRTDSESRPATGLIRKRLTFENVRDPSLEALLNWVRFATEDVPGLEVYSVTIKPEANVWHMKVVFTRWERAGT